MSFKSKHIYTYNKTEEPGLFLHWKGKKGELKRGIEPKSSVFKLVSEYTSPKLHENPSVSIVS